MYQSVTFSSVGMIRRQCPPAPVCPPSLIPQAPHYPKIVPTNLAKIPLLKSSPLILSLHNLYAPLLSWIASLSIAQSFIVRMTTSLPPQQLWAGAFSTSLPRRMRTSSVAGSMSSKDGVSTNVVNRVMAALALVNLLFAKKDVIPRACLQLLT